MLQQFVMRQAISLVVSVVVKLIDKHKQGFDLDKAKSAAEDKVRDLVPPSLWGEPWVEGKLIGVTDFMLDTMSEGLDQSAKLIEDVLIALSEQKLDDAIGSVRKFVLSLLEDKDALEGVPEEEHASAFEASVLQAYQQEVGE